MRRFATAIGTIIGLYLLMEATSPLPAGADQHDSFLQQFANYLTTGNPRTPRILGAAGGAARVFDQENCVVGFEDNQGGTFKILLNNIDPHSVAVSQEVLRIGIVQVLSFSGAPYVVDVQLKDPLLATSFLAVQIDNGKHSSILLPVDGMDPNRIVRAFNLLYDENYCTGLDAAL